MEFVSAYLEIYPVLGSKFFKKMEEVLYSFREKNSSSEEEIEVKSVDQILCKKYLVETHDSVFKEFFEKKIQIKILHRGKQHCCYFITIGPIKEHQLHKIFNVVINDRGDEEKDLTLERIPGAIVKARTVILTNFLKKLRKISV